MAPTMAMISWCHKERLTTRPGVDMVKHKEWIKIVKKVRLMLFSLNMMTYRNLVSVLVCLGLKLGL